jgi:hypothetical protein
MAAEDFAPVKVGVAGEKRCWGGKEENASQEEEKLKRRKKKKNVKQIEWDLVKIVTFNLSLYFLI